MIGKSHNMKNFCQDNNSKACQLVSEAFKLSKHCKSATLGLKSLKNKLSRDLSKIFYFLYGYRYHKNNPYNISLPFCLATKVKLQEK